MTPLMVYYIEVIEVIKTPLLWLAMLVLGYYWGYIIGYKERYK